MPGTPCILIVDDEPFVPRVLGLKFAQAGYRTVVARNGEEGLRLIGSERPDVVITDISMPVMDGSELCRRALPLRAAHSFLLIVVTSRTERELREWVSELPDVALYEKPVSPREILRLVQDWLSRERAAC